jgi:hypothetical protein
MQRIVMFICADVHGATPPRACLIRQVLPQ